jgi:copper transport protein
VVIGRIVLAALATLLVAAPSASGHAVVQETTPARGASLPQATDRVVVRFNEPVEAAFGAVRVFDADSRRVDEGAAIRPGGDETIGVRLKDGLPAGTYVATYRVVSADSHPVTGGFVFAVGSGGTKSAPAVSDLVRGDAGPTTDIAFGVARGVTYAATALLLGGLLFLLLVWRRAAAPGAAGAAAGRRARRAGLWAAVAGVVAGMAGIVLQGATAAGVSAWSALDPGVLRDVLETRFGRVWLLRELAFALLGAGLALARPPRGEEAGGGRSASAARPPRVVAGASTLFSGLPLPARPAWLVVVVATAFLAAAPALAGHASNSSPAAVLLPLDVIHVVAMSLWLGGLAAFVLVVPAATRALEPAARSRLLASLLVRFSPLALACVAALVATGLVQSILHVEELGALVDTGFGRAVLVKVALLAGLIALGVVQRRRILPSLRRIASGGQPPGDTGRVLRRTLRAEASLGVAVLGASAALVAYPPPDSLAGGPFAVSERMGPLTLEATVDPARVGRNELHVYLLDARTGAPFDGTKELRVTMRLPSQDIGPIAARPRRAGPGHYVVEGLDLVPRGAWRVEVASRVSEFDEHSATFEVQAE